MNEKKGAREKPALRKKNSDGEKGGCGLKFASEAKPPRKTKIVYCS